MVLGIETDSHLNFYKNLYSSDIIYHYTKASTAIDFILYNKKLRFNNTRTSADPIESNRAERSTLYYTDRDRSNCDSGDLKKIYAFIDDLEDRFYQICFCRNTMGADLAIDSTFKGQEEIFGFAKPRMWDQYGDKFTGVCLAFSKEKILSQNSNLELIDKEVKYLSFQELSVKKVGNIQGDHLLNVGIDQYKEQMEQLIKNAFFYKHLDYSGEDEYRIGTLFDEAKCGVEFINDEIHRNMMLDIGGCIKAIFVSSYANKRQKNTLLEYATSLNVKMIEMQWRHDSFEAIDYVEWMNFLKEMNQKSQAK